MENNNLVNANAQQAALAPANVDFMTNLEELKRRADYVGELKRQIMVKDRHYGVIPGCGNKPTLLKNGAELLCMAFRLASDANVEIHELGNGHREYTVTTRLTSMATGELVATGLGSCSTMESKYRYRNVADYEVTGQPIPGDSKERKAEYRKQGFGMKKVDGEWCWVRFKDSQKSENPDIADQYNTVLKMASKRSLIDATLKATGGSCEFTQDIEDNPGALGGDTADMYDEAPYSRASQQRPQAAPARPKRSESDLASAFATKMEGLRNEAPEIYDAYMVQHKFKDAASVPPAKRKDVVNDIMASISATRFNDMQEDADGENSNGQQE